MEATPEYLDYTEIMETFLDIEGVVRVHNLRIWVRIERNDSCTSRLINHLTLSSIAGFER